MHNGPTPNPTTARNSWQHWAPPDRYLVWTSCPGRRGFGTEWMTSSFYVSSCILWLSVTYKCSERERDRASGILHSRIRNALTQMSRIGYLIICYSFLRSLFR